MFACPPGTKLCAWQRTAFLFGLDFQAVEDGFQKEDRVKMMGVVSFLLITRNH